MKLHIGGISKKDGWKILNILDGANVDFIGSITDLSQFEDESVSEIYASHVFEHVPLGDALPTLRGMWRILIRGGKLYLSVPDLDVLCRAFLNPTLTIDQRFHIARMMFGGQVDAHDFHFFGWNYEFAFNFLSLANFRNISRINDFGLFEDTSSFRPYGFPISLNLIAIK